MNRKIGGLPLWAWISVAAAGAALGYLLFVRKRKSTGTNISANDLAALQAGSGQNAAPADSLSAGTLAALLAQMGIDPAQLVTQGDLLAALSLGQNSGALPSTTTGQLEAPASAGFQTFEPVASFSEPTPAPTSGPTAQPQRQPQAGPLPVVAITWPWQEPTPGSIVIRPPAAPVSSGPVAPIVPHGHPVAA